MTTLHERPTAALLIDVQNGVKAEAYERNRVIGNIATLVERARVEQVPVIRVQHLLAVARSTMAHRRCGRHRRRGLHGDPLTIGAPLGPVRQLGAIDRFTGASLRDEDRQDR